MHHAMMAGEKKMKSMKMTGDVDHDFAMMMVPHHRTAIEMSRIQLREGKAPKIRAMAEKMIDAQQKEIEELEEWMAAHQR